MIQSQLNLFLLALTVMCDIKTIMFVNLLIVHQISYACVNQLEVQNYLMQIASQEVAIAEIPQYKKAILLDKPDKYNLTTDKINLINAYKKSHLKNKLDEVQISKINELENTKKEFFKSHELCK